MCVFVVIFVVYLDGYLLVICREKPDFSCILIRENCPHSGARRHETEPSYFGSVVNHEVSSLFEFLFDKTLWNVS